MMTNVDDIRGLITEALQAEARGEEDRGGNSPLGLLSTRLELMLPHGEEAELFSIAISGLIRTPVTIEGLDDERFWGGLSFLAQHHPNNPCKPIQDAFEARLFGDVVLVDRLMPYALMGFAAAGGRLPPAALMKLDELRRLFPATWLGAAVRMAHFDFVKAQIKTLISARVLPLRGLVMRLDNWSAIWDRTEDFGRMAVAWFDLAEQAGCADVALMRQWLELRGFLNPTPNCGPASVKVLEQGEGKVLFVDFKNTTKRGAVPKDYVAKEG